MAKLFSKKTKKKVLAVIAPRLLYFFLSLLFLSCKKRYHFDKKASDSSHLFVFWHGELIMLAFAYPYYRGRKTIDSIISEHGDGEIASRFIEILGGGTIRGSSTRGGAKALKGAFKSIAQNRDIGITPDGPKGPRHSISDGVVLIAQKKNIPIVAINCNVSSCWRFKSWDKAFIPKPFSTLDFYFSDPFYLEGLDKEEAKKLVKERLMKYAF